MELIGKMCSYESGWMYCGDVNILYSWLNIQYIVQRLCHKCIVTNKVPASLTSLTLQKTKQKTPQNSLWVSRNSWHVPVNLGLRFNHSDLLLIRVRHGIQNKTWNGLVDRFGLWFAVLNCTGWVRSRLPRCVRLSCRHWLISTRKASFIETSKVTPSCCPWMEG